ncbi:hypothetical protein L198_07103 [Cryptococcus wingfieldii CBS 7118]|uniref:Uncharacterized protein n=1 Tax=Cryptococcus wingfieldii CBS 7118 TaxID=1295528 RepID=A0A1E3IH82_9TREE|nr:hypothetical protein L198_07103 [Cryptococcus wingfieldii CBS 7118]ODN87101.1 hypothetical protein L198_07103 [Cryptococcus wingfieldii CBS 7118]
MSQDDNKSNKPRGVYTAFPSQVGYSTDAPPSRPPASPTTRSRMEAASAYSVVEEPQESAVETTSSPRSRRPSRNTRTVSPWSATSGRFTEEENAMYSNIISDKGSVGPPPPTDEEVQRQKRAREAKAESGIFGNTRN